MMRYVFVVTAAAVMLVAGVLLDAASAQTKAKGGSVYRPDAAPKPMPSHGESLQEYSEYPDGFDEYGGGYGDGYYRGDCGPGGCDGCDSGCNDCSYGGGYRQRGSWCDFFDCCGLLSAPGQPRTWYATADYLYVRASFSEAVAYLEQDQESLPAQSIETFHQLNFRHESSYRFGGGYYLNCCDEQVRFNFTRLSSYADQQVVPPSSADVLITLPYEVAIPPGGQGLVDANVDVNAFDLEYAKTIPLGGSQCNSCDCGDACGGGCGGPCPCPAWDITWSGGIRFADVDWERSYVALDDEGTLTQYATPRMEFSGGGPRFGLEGRRYFGEHGWCSIFLKGDVSLLLGTLNQTTVRVTSPDTVDESSVTQSVNCRHIIPVTEIETGMTVRLTSFANLSTGYLFSAWHDLGFRDQFDFLNTLETSYDDANILGFDGLFVNLEVAF
jgi:hypothetical protein